MAKEFWEDEEAESESDTVMSEEEANDILLEEESEEEEEQQEEVELTEDEETELSEKVLQDANLRLEQGNLYKMLLEHDLFQDANADQIAVKNVTREIRTFIRERLEVLVGLKEDPKIQKKKAALGGSQIQGLTDLEWQLLKTMLAKATSSPKVLSAKPQAESNHPTPMRVAPKPTPSPVTNKSSKVRVVEKTKSAPPKKTDKKTQGSGWLKKHPKDMTVQELIEANKKVSNKHQGRRAEPARKAAALDGEQMTRHYQNQALTSGNSAQSSLVATIVAQTGKQLTQLEYVGNGDDGGFDPNDRI